MASGQLVVGALAGFASSVIMDQATSRFYVRQSDASQRKEEELAPGGTLVQLSKQLGQAAGRDLSDESAQRVGVALHRTLGMSYGVAATYLIGRGMRPVWAGLAMGIAAFVVVDEGTAISSFSDYPMESHMRGVVGHGTYGLAAGLLLALIERG